MKDLGEASYVVGIQIVRDRKNILLALSQSSYIDKVFTRFAMPNSKKGLLPTQHRINLSRGQSCVDLNPLGYIDSDFQSDKDSRNSTSGSMFALGGTVVVWRSVKQSSNIDSAMETEQIAACEATKESVWLKKFYTDLEVVPGVDKPVTL